MDKDVMDAPVQIVMLANSGHKAFDTRIFHKEAKSLSGAGFKVSIILPHDRDEQKEGIFILSVPVYRKGWNKLIQSPWLVYKKAKQQPKTSWFHLHDSELLWIGILLKCSGRKVIYDAHEDTPLQIAYQHWIPRWLRTPYATLYFLLEKLSGYLFEAVIVAEPVMAKYFPAQKTVLIRNFPIVSSFQQSDSTAYQKRDKTVVYVGLLSKARGVVEMAEGVQLASKHTAFRFVLGGEFSPASLQAEILNQYAVEFLAWVPFEKLVTLLFQSQIGIIVPHPLERYKTNYPVKLFEYMAAALPVIASRYGEAAHFVRDANAGILVDPMNSVEIANAITWLFEHPEEAEAMGQRGRKKVFDTWNWEEESKTLIDLYKRLTTK